MRLLTPVLDNIASVFMCLGPELETESHLQLLTSCLSNASVKVAPIINENFHFKEFLQLSL